MRNPDHPQASVNAITSGRREGRSSEATRLGSRAIVLAILLVCIFFLWPATKSLAQVYSGSLTGVVRDPSGAVIPGAKVTVTDTEKGFHYSATTNDAGLYTLVNLPPSTYRLTVSKQGFQEFVRSGVTLVVNQHATVNVQLQVGSATQSVTVTGTAALLAAQDATTGQTVDRRLINDLPLVGRSVFDLAFLTPGINPAPVSVFGPNTMANNFTSNGGRNATADVLLDGVSVTAPEQNTQVLNPLYVPSVDAVQEYKVEQNNFSADKGFSGNTVVNVVMRSGTNQFHGSVYEFFRDNSLDANNWFNNRAGINIPGLHYNEFGFTVGGPIQKDKTFFFADYQGSRQSSLATFSAGVPSQAERNGDFSELCADNGGTFNAAGLCSAAGGQLWDPYSGVYTPSAGGPVRSAFIPFNNMASYQSPGNPLLNGTPYQLPARPGNLIDPVAFKMMQYYPLPNLNVGSSAYNRFDNWAGTGANVSNGDQFDVKIDRQISDTSHFNGRMSLGWGNGQGANPWNNPLNTDTQGPNTSGQQLGVLNFNHNFGPTLLFTASYGYTRSSTYTLGVSKDFPSFNPVTTLGLPSYIGTSGINAAPTIYIDGGYNYVGPESLGAQAWSVLHYALETHDLLASLDKMSGRHEFLMGGEMRVERDSFLQPGVPDGVFEFNYTGTSQQPFSGGGDALATFLTGVGGPGSWGQYEIPLAVSTQNFEYAGYLQDNWHATDKLTLNLGVRYDLWMPRTERYNRMEWINPNVTSPLQVPPLSSAATAVYTSAGLPVPNLSTLRGGLQFASPSERYPVNPFYGGFAPRFGLAYRLPHDTVLRGGYGIFYSVPDYVASGTGLGVFDGFLQDTPWVNTYQNNGATPFGRLSNPWPTGLILPPGSSEGLKTDLGLGVTGMVRNWNHPPYVQTWSFGLEHQFGGVLVDAEYVGTKGTDLYFAQAGGLNYLGPWVQNASASQITALKTYVPNPYFGVINTPGCGICGSYIPASQLLTPFSQFNGFGGPSPPWANSTYNAFQLRVEKKFTNGLEFLGNYTWSKTMDESSVQGSNTTWLGGTAPTPQDPNNLALEYALSEYDIPQVLTFSYVYQLPFGHGQHWGPGWNKWVNGFLGGWQTQGLWRFDDGQPLELTSNVSNPLPTYGPQRPNLLAPLRQNNCSETCMVSQFFGNPTDAVTPAPNTLGDAPRTIGSVRAPGTQNASLSLFKEIPISKLGEAGHMEIRVESFNALNHVQFCAPNTLVGTGSFGLVSCQANLPRQLQLAAKLYW
jgi:hypothetical protein